MTVAVLCLADTDAGVGLKSTAQDSSAHSTRIFWHSNNAHQRASNATGVPVHRDSTLSHRDVSRETMCLQQDEVISHHRHQQQKVSSSVGQYSKHSRSHNEHFVTPVHTDTNVNGPDNWCSTDAVKLSGWGTSLPDSGEGLCSASKSQRVQGKCKPAVSESAMFVATPSQHVSSANSNNSSSLLDYHKCDVTLDFSRSEWSQSVQGTGASVSRDRQSRTALERELSTATDKGQNCAAAARDQRMHGAQQESAGRFADENSNVTGDSFLSDDVRESERLQRWFSSRTSHHGNLSVCLSVVDAWLSMLCYSAFFVLQAVCFVFLYLMYNCKNVPLYFEP